MDKAKELNASFISFETKEGSRHKVITTGKFTKEYKEAINELTREGLIDKATIDNEVLTTEIIRKEIESTEAIIVNPKMLKRYIKEKAIDNKISES